MPCDKKFFTSLKQAEKFAKWTMRIKGWRSKKMRGYKCKECTGFHVSSQPVSRDKDKLNASLKKKRRQKDRLNSRKAKL